MRSSLLTGLTGVIAVLVLAYVGLTALNLQPHITFGDPVVKVASADRPENVPPPAPAPARPAAADSAASPTASIVSPAVATDKPLKPASQPESPPSATAPSNVAAGKMVNAAQEHAGPPFAAPPPSATSSEATGALTAVPTQQQSAAPVIAEAKQDAPEASENPVAKSEVAKPPEPSLSMIPTPEARPEPRKEEPTREMVDASAPPENPVADTQAPKPADAPKDEGAGVTPAAPSNDAPKPSSDPELKTVDLSRPLAERAGILTIGNRVIRLAGIEPTDPARSCTGQDGKEWPCGTLARTALRAFLLGRTVTCDVADPQWAGSVTATCRFARVDLSEWLARNGWAEPAAGSPLSAVADEARRNSVGIYGNDPRKRGASTLAPAPAKEDPLNPI